MTLKDLSAIPSRKPDDKEIVSAWSETILEVAEQRHRIGLRTNVFAYAHRITTMFRDGEKLYREIRQNGMFLQAMQYHGT